MFRALRLVFLLFWIAGSAGLALAGPPDAWARDAAQEQGEHPRVVVASVQGVVNPVMLGYFERVIARASSERAAAVLIQLDTPGGLESSMRDIVQLIVNSDVPVIVHVYPAGGRAASAGLFILQAAHVAAMAPNTNVGSAHPVSLAPGGEGQSPQPDNEILGEKVTNDAVALIRNLAETRGRNVEWVESAVRESVNVGSTDALEMNIVDMVAPNAADVLAKSDGRIVEVNGESVTLNLRDARLLPSEMTLLEQIGHAISDPNIAYILLSIGVYGLIYELANPGAVFPGAIGVVSILFAFFALGTLPVNYVALALLLFGFALLIAEVFITPGIGALAVGGVISVLMGSLLLFNTPMMAGGVSLWLVLTVVVLTAVFFLVVVAAAVRAMRRRSTTGAEALIGRLGRAKSDLSPEGVVTLDGELWQARAVSTDVIASDSTVRVVAQENLKLRVEGTEER